MPVGEKAEIVFAGQTGTGHAPQRFETNIKFRPNENHQVRINGAIGRLGDVKIGGRKDRSANFHSRPWTNGGRTRGAILVLGFDYSRFMGAGNDYSLSPRLGLQFDINSKTRFRSAYTTQTEDRTWSHAIELENAEVIVPRTGLG